ncbi:DegT/DnrJ/EryC1/StrS family aminotransferase [Pseudomonadota bacterium]
MEFIDLKRQYQEVRRDVEAGIQAVLSGGNYILGPEVLELENRLAEFVDAKHCVAVSSGTDALLLSLMALGIGAGDEVVTTAFSFVATAEVIAMLGATPVYVDIDPKTCNMDVASVESVMTPKTRAIIAVSLYGQCADFGRLNPVAEKYGVPVIEDGAQSFGARHYDRSSCNLSLIGCTSFFPSKPLGGYGDGGAVFTSDDELNRLLRELRVHGQDRRYHHARLGLNARMDSIQAAILLAKLKIFPAEVRARQLIGDRYCTELATAGIETIKVLDFNTSVYAQYTIKVESRDAVREKLSSAGIPSAVHYPIPLYRQPALFQHDIELEETEKASKCVLSLPMHPYLSHGEQDRVIESVVSACLTV